MTMYFIMTFIAFLFLESEFIISAEDVITLFYIANIYLLIMCAKIVVAPLKSICFNKSFLHFSCIVLLNCSFVVGLVKLCTN